VLCGSYFPSIYGGGLPEDNEGVKRFLGALGRLQRARSIGFAGCSASIWRTWEFATATSLKQLADADRMLAVAERDRGRMERIAAGDATGFWELVRENHDDLKWCGSSPFLPSSKCAPLRAALSIATNSGISIRRAWSVSRQCRFR